MKPARRFLGRHVLSVERAAAPSDYVYENLAFPARTRRLRKVASNAVVAAVLLASLALVVLLKSYQKDVIVRKDLGQTYGILPPKRTSCFCKFGPLVHSPVSPWLRHQDVSRSRSKHSFVACHHEPYRRASRLRPHAR